MKPEASGLGLGSETCVWAGPACRECALGPVTVEAGEAGSKALAPCPTQHRAALARGPSAPAKRGGKGTSVLDRAGASVSVCSVGLCKQGPVGPKASQGSAAQPHPLYP